MRVLIPVPTHGESVAERLFSWLRSVEAARNLETVFVATEDSRVASLAEQWGATILPACSTEGGDTLLAAGAASSLALLPAGDVMVLDPLRPVLPPEELDRAVREFVRSGAEVLISVAELRDNPCQLEAYYAQKDSGLIHCFENDREVLGEMGLHSAHGMHHISHPFLFDWERHAVADEGKGSCFVRRVQEGRRVAYVPMDAAALPEEPFWLRVDDVYARVGVPAWGLNEMAKVSKEFVPMGSTVRKAAPVRAYKGPGKSWALEFSECAPGMTVVILPLLDGLEAQPLERRLNREGVAKLTCSGTVTGFAFWLLAEIGDSSGYDFRMDFPGEGALWESEPGSNLRRNLMTGERIVGRHCFPEVFGPDTMLSIVRADDVAGLHEAVANGAAYGFVLNPDAASPMEIGGMRSGQVEALIG